MTLNRSWSFAAALASSMASGAWCDVALTPVAVQGQVAQGTGGIWSQFLGSVGFIGSPVIDEGGRVAFRAFLAGVPTAADSGVFAGHPSVAAGWAREGSVLPDGSGLFTQNSSNQVGFPVLGSGGHLIAQLPSGVGGVIALGPSAAPVAVHRANQPAPGLAGVTLRTLLPNPAMGSQGQYAFMASLLGGGLDFQNGLFSSHTGALSIVAYTTGPVPGWAGSTYSFIGPPTFAGPGVIAFEAVTSLGQAIMSDRGGSLAPVVRAGDPAPGLAGVTLATVRHPVRTTPNAPAINIHGEVAFPAGLSSGSSALFTDVGGVFRPIAVAGQPIPGIPGAVWTSFSAGPALGISDEGDVAFYHQAWFSGFGFDAVFVDRRGTIEMLARQGLPSPVEGLDYDAMRPDTVRVNSTGLVAFTGLLAGPGVTGANDLALFATTMPEGEVVVVVREGQLVDVFGDGAVFRTLSSFQFSADDASNAFNPSSGRGAGHSAFNAEGELALLLRFTDGTEGIYVARLPSFCPGDLSGSSDPNDGDYGDPDGSLDAADFFYYLDQFTLGSSAEADLTGSSDPNDPAYGVPDGTLDIADFFYFLDLFVRGCP